MSLVLNQGKTRMKSASDLNEIGVQILLNSTELRNHAWDKIERQKVTTKGTYADTVYFL